MERFSFAIRWFLLGMVAAYLIVQVFGNEGKRDKLEITNKTEE